MAPMTPMTRRIQHPIGLNGQRRKTKPLSPEQKDEIVRRQYGFLVKSILIASPLFIAAMIELSLSTPSPTHEVKASVLDTESFSAMLPFMNSCHATLRIEEGNFKGQELACEIQRPSAGCKSLENEKAGRFIATFREIDRTQRSEINPQPFDCLSFRVAK